MAVSVRDQVELINRFNDELLAAQQRGRSLAQDVSGMPLPLVSAKFGKQTVGSAILSQLSAVENASVLLQQIMDNFNLNEDGQPQGLSRSVGRNGPRHTPADRLAQAAGAHKQAAAAPAAVPAHDRSEIAYRLLRAIRYKVGK